MTELYEVLYSDYPYNCEVGDVLRFRNIDEDDNVFDDVVRILEVIDVDISGTLVKGFSEVTNDTSEFMLDNELEYEVLGG